MKVAAAWNQNCAFSCSHTRAKSPYHHRPAPGLPPTAATVPAVAARWATAMGAARLSSAMRISTLSPVTQLCPDKKSTRGTHTSSRDIRTEKLPRRNSDRWCRWGRLAKTCEWKRARMSSVLNISVRYTKCFAFPGVLSLDWHRQAGKAYIPNVRCQRRWFHRLQGVYVGPLRSIVGNPRGKPQTNLQDLWHK